MHTHQDTHLCRLGPPPSSALASQSQVSFGGDTAQAPPLLPPYHPLTRRGPMELRAPRGAQVSGAPSGSRVESDPQVPEPERKLRDPQGCGHLKQCPEPFAFKITMGSHPAFPEDSTEQMQRLGRGAHLTMGKGAGWRPPSWFSYDRPSEPQAHAELPTAPPPSPGPGPWQPGHHPLAKAVWTLCWAPPCSLGG